MENPKKVQLKRQDESSARLGETNSSIKINDVKTQLSMMHNTSDSFLLYLRHFDGFKSTYPSSQASFSSMKTLTLSSKSEFLSGYFSACASITILFPFNKLIFRQILEGISFIEAFKQLKAEGLANVYRGLLPPLLQKSASYSIMFGTVLYPFLYVCFFI